jgi:hypothetical protein
MNARKLLLATLCTAAMIAPVAAQAGEVYNREANQENRIYQGVQNGSLTRGQYDRLQSREAQINDQRINELRRNGGHLTGWQYAQLNREENRLSGRIYVDKHDGRP